jgi:hypothetical protein
VKVQRWQGAVEEILRAGIYFKYRGKSEVDKKGQKRGCYYYKIKGGTQLVEYVLKCDRKASNRKV